MQQSLKGERLSGGKLPGIFFQFGLRLPGARSLQPVWSGNLRMGDLPGLSVKSWVQAAVSMREVLQGGFQRVSKFTNILLKTKVDQVASGLKSASLLHSRKYKVDCRKYRGFGVGLFGVFFFLKIFY